MNRGLVFILGLIVGVFLMLFVYNDSSGDPGSNSLYGDSGISLFSEPGEDMTFRSFKVFQVLTNGTALAYGSVNKDEQFYYSNGTVVLFLPMVGRTFYDDQVLKVLSKQCVRQVGTYRYKTKDHDIKTVPIVQFFDK